MTGRNIKKAVTFLTVAALLYAAMMLRVYASETTLAPLLRNAIHIGLLVAWSISVRDRVMQPQALKLLSLIIRLMLFWFIIRMFKYEFVQSVTVSRYIWYLYYLPMLFIPLCALFIAMLLGKSELARLPKYAAIPTVISAVLFLFVITNDLHQLVFFFPNGKPGSDSEYGYGPVYYSILIWLLVCGLVFLVILLYKCRVPKSRKFIWLPGVSVMVLLIYTMLYLLRVQWLFDLFGDITAAFCLSYAAILESCMQTGLIQTNTGYDMLFEASVVRAQITDESWNIRYQSGDSPLDSATLKKAESAPVLLNRNTLLKTNKISGGHVAWQEDVTELLDTLEQLAENQRELEDENFLEGEALRTKQEVLRLQEKNRLYDLIGKYTRPQTEFLYSLLREYDCANGENLRRRLLAKICVIGAYIKRCGNLLLIRESSESAPISELVKAIEESLQNFELTGAECGLTCTAERDIPAEVTVEAYTFFERIVEAFLDKTSYLWINLRERDEKLLLHIEAETAAEIPPFENYIEARTEDGVKLITVCYDMGGEHR